MSGSTTDKQYQKETITRTSSDASSYALSTSDPVMVARSTDLLPLTVFKIAAYATEYIIPYIFYFVNYSYC